MFTIANGVNVTLSELFGALEELAETRAELAATKVQLRGTEDSLAGSQNLLADTISRVAVLERMCLSTVLHCPHLLCRVHADGFCRAFPDWQR